MDVEDEITELLSRIVKISELMGKQMDLMFEYKRQISTLTGRVLYLENAMFEIISERGKSEAVQELK